ncbi:hypothetical protein [Archangium violaceum]|uniref:MarR family transcriptional regulator n=1 Tax=Archangium violaceum Cb vi76 TaxID=1406225 RepID=A0A084SE02_9BACT|nr:hypothetical protein [Archangium violaceum]KFA86687.1 hypothetical protein Q664_52685 [Archangium violaceum Cb vi76]
MAKAKKPSGALSPSEALVLVYLWLNPGSTVSDVRVNAPEPRALAVLRALKARRLVQIQNPQSKRMWRVCRAPGELMAIGARVHRESLAAFRHAPSGARAET